MLHSSKKHEILEYNTTDLNAGFAIRYMNDHGHVT